MTTNSHGPRINGHHIAPSSASPAPAPGRSHRGLIAAGAVVSALVAVLALSGRGWNSKDTAPAPPAAGSLSTEPARSTQGAQRAAAAIASAIGSERMFAPSARHTLIHQVAYPGDEAKLQAEADEDYTAFSQKIGLDTAGRAPQGARLLSRTAVAGTSTRQYTDDHAVVDCWATGGFGLTGPGHDKPFTSWFTMTITLKWHPSSGTWRMADVSQTKGPAPEHGPIGQAPPL